MISRDSNRESALADRMLSFFGTDGALSISRDFEYRPQQQEMAIALAHSLEQSSPLVVEAGTGVGKSLAYLAPAVCFAVENHRKAVISTHTINLQEQLIDKDLPLLASLLDIGFSAVLMKGRGNYLCPRRLSRALADAADLFDTADMAELEAISDWAEHTCDGSLSDLDLEPSARVWAQVCSESHVCTPKSCGHDDECFYQAVRKEVIRADVVVLNHTLLFTLMSLMSESEDAGEGFVFPDDFLIIDEAHTLEDTAARQLGMRVSQAGLKFDLNRLYNPGKRRGLFQAVRHPAGVECVAALGDAVECFFDVTESACEFGKWGGEFRVPKGDFFEDTLAEHLLRLEGEVKVAANKVNNDSTRAELLELGRRVRESRISITAFIKQSVEGHVYWVERRKDGAGGLSLNSAPINVAPDLRAMFFAKGKSCVVTSATLSVGESHETLGYFRERVGASAVRSLQIGSPFDYSEQMKIFLSGSMPDPRSTQYEDALIKWVGYFIDQSEGRAFVLFTSYRLMNAVAEKMENFFEERGYQLLVQGRRTARHKMLREFREDVSSVLFGTDSFWAGVDVPGEALSNVIVTRLPFSVPDHPLTASRLEAIEQSGGNPFLEYSVPEAILKLRQGVGRLIRSVNDRGIVVILDNRVLSKRYGKAFLRALPAAPLEVVDE
ncbi:MAG: helicase C-terminal domain-containing protein [Verrucomicrobiales bacterium]